MKRKGEYGYRKSYKIKNGIIIGFFICIIILLFVASKFAPQDASRILLVSSILMVLPMANLLSPYLVVFKYKSMEYGLIKDCLDDRHFLFDIILTMKEQVMPLDIIFIQDEKIFAYMSNNANIKKTEEFIKDRMKIGNINVNVKVCNNFNDLKKFISNGKYKDENSLEEIKGILRSLSV